MSPSVASPPASATRAAAAPRARAGSRRTRTPHSWQPCHAGQDTPHLRLGAAHVRDRPLLAGEQREELHGQRREPAGEVLDHPRVGGAAQRHPLEIAQARARSAASPYAASGASAATSHRPSPAGSRRRRAGAGQTARARGPARAGAQPGPGSRGRSRCPGSGSSFELPRAHPSLERGDAARRRRQGRRGNHTPRPPPRPATRRRSAATDRRSVARARRHRRQAPEVSALTITAGTAIPSRRSRASSRSVSRRGSSAARVTATTPRPGGVGQQRAQLAQPARGGDQLGGDLAQPDHLAVLEQDGQQRVHPPQRGLRHLEQPQGVAGGRGVQHDDGVRRLAAPAAPRRPRAPRTARRAPAAPGPSARAAPAGRRRRRTASRAAARRTSPRRRRDSARASGPSAAVGVELAGAQAGGRPRHRALVVVRAVSEHVAERVRGIGRQQQHARSPAPAPRQRQRRRRRARASCPRPPCPRRRAAARRAARARSSQAAAAWRAR